MKPKPVIARASAVRDVDESISHYLREANERTALGFIDDLERAYRHISSHPATGSARYAQELRLPGLRSWPLKKFPHMVFYVERVDHIDVWRVLHAERDIPAWMREPSEE